MKTSHLWRVRRITASQKWAIVRFLRAQNVQFSPPSVVNYSETLPHMFDPHFVCWCRELKTTHTVIWCLRRCLCVMDPQHAVLCCEICKLIRYVVLLVWHRFKFSVISCSLVRCAVLPKILSVHLLVVVIISLYFI